MVIGPFFLQSLSFLWLMATHPKQANDKYEKVNSIYLLGCKYKKQNSYDYKKIPLDDIIKVQLFLPMLNILILCYYVFKPLLTPLSTFSLS